MQALRKVLSTLFAAFFIAAAGASVAAPDASPVKSQTVMNGADSGTQQTPDTPPDCKKKPSDPRCK